MAATLELKAKDDATEVVWKLEQANLRLTEQVKQLAAASGRATKEAKSGFEKVTSSMDGGINALTRMAAGYLTVQTAISGVTAAMQDLEEQRRRSREGTTDQADAQRNMLRNLGNVSDAEQLQFMSKLQDMALRRSPSGGVKTVYNMTATGLSASGADREKTLAAVDMALQFAPDNPEAATSITGALLHMSKATGRSDMLENLGFLKLAGEQAAITDWDKIAQNMSPAIIGATSFGATPQEALALVASITQGSADKMGAESGTAAISLAQQLEKFLPTEDVYGQVAVPGRKGKRRGLVTKGTGLETLGERIQYLQENPLEREKFLENLTLEKKSLGPVMQILEGPQTMGGKAYADAFAAANMPFEKMAELATTKIEQMGKVYEQQVAESSRGAEVRGELAKTQTPSGRERSIEGGFTSEKLDTMLKDHGVDYWSRTLEAWFAYYVSAPVIGEEQAFLKSAKRAAFTLRKTGHEEEAASLEADTAKRVQEAEDQRIAAVQLDLLEQHKALMQQIEQNTRRTGEGTERIEQNTRGPQPAAVQANVTQHGEGGR